MDTRSLEIYIYIYIYIFFLQHGQNKLAKICMPSSKKNYVYTYIYNIGSTPFKNIYIQGVLKDNFTFIIITSILLFNEIFMFGFLF